MFKKLFLPVGMISAILLSFACPQVGIAMKKTLGSNLFIVLIFLICGWRTKFGEMKFDRKFMRNFLVCGIMALIISPFIGLTYTNGILIISIPWHRNFAISLFFSFLSFPLSGMSLHKLFLQQMSYTCQYISILSSNALMQAHFFPGSLNYHNIL